MGNADPAHKGGDPHPLRKKKKRRSRIEMGTPNFSKTTWGDPPREKEELTLLESPSSWRTGKEVPLKMIYQRKERVLGRKKRNLPALRNGRRHRYLFSREKKKNLYSQASRGGKGHPKASPLSKICFLLSTTQEEKGGIKLQIEKSIFPKGETLSRKERRDFSSLSLRVGGIKGKGRGFLRRQKKKPRRWPPEREPAKKSPPGRRGESVRMSIRWHQRGWYKKRKGGGESALL